MPKPNHPKSGRGQRKHKGPTVADRADRHVLYQAAVQTPEADIEFCERVFRELRGRDPKTLREDFCGTAYLATKWAQSHPERSAIGVDLDGPTLAWGQKHNLEPAGPEVARRVQLIESDVLEVREPKVDVICALNFSYCAFHTRQQLRRYFSVVYDGLRDDGVFVSELFGGTESMIELEDERDVGRFTYVWEQEKFNPLTHRTRCHIGFTFPDGSKLKRAFSYEWRLWMLPEVRDLLEEVGFRNLQIYWEEVDEDGEGTGEYRPAGNEENQESWLVYIVAPK